MKGAGLSCRRGRFPSLRQTYDVRLLTYLPGIPWRSSTPTALTCSMISATFWRTTVAFADFSHPAMHRHLHWDMAHTSATIRQRLEYIQEPDQHALVETVLARFENEVTPRLPALRQSVIHSDANDYNVLVTAERKQPRRIAGLIDFGDMVHSATIFELAIAAAYAMLDKPDPLAVAAHMVAGYHAALPLTDLELELLDLLIRARLATSVTLSTYQQTLHPDDPIWSSASSRPGRCCANWMAFPPPWRAPYSVMLVDWNPYRRQRPFPVTSSPTSAVFIPILGADWQTLNPRVFDSSVGSLELGSPADYGNLPAAAKRIEMRLKTANAQVGIGRYDEPRLIYSADSFRTASSEWRTIHISSRLICALRNRLFTPPFPGKSTVFMTTICLSTTVPPSSWRTKPMKACPSTRFTAISAENLWLTGQWANESPPESRLPRSALCTKTAVGRPISISRLCSTCWAKKATSSAWPLPASAKSGRAFA
ncbi:MAG: phosphotransferase [Chloroflexi bacterium]|nr:phosphotransferase [Chloroflexota bacterium]